MGRSFSSVNHNFSGLTKISTGIIHREVYTTLDVFSEYFLPLNVGNPFIISIISDLQQVGQLHRLTSVNFVELTPVFVTACHIFRLMTIMLISLFQVHDLTKHPIRCPDEGELYIKDLDFIFLTTFALLLTPPEMTFTLSNADRFQFWNFNIFLLF